MNPIIFIFLILALLATGLCLGKQSNSIAAEAGKGILLVILGPVLVMLGHPSAWNDFEGAAVLFIPVITSFCFSVGLFFVPKSVDNRERSEMLMAKLLAFLGSMGWFISVAEFR